MAPGNGQPHIELGVGSRASPGQVACGDLYTVHRRCDGYLLAVVDGLGHGAEAASAAQSAIDTIAGNPDDSIISLLKRCHEILRPTRGAVASIATISVRNDTVTWLSVGNVEGILLRADPLAVPRRESILQRGGVVGFRLPPLQTSELSLQDGDTVILATDGVMPGFEKEFRPGQQAQELADQICTRYAKDSDDALVLVAKYVRNPA